MESEVAIVQTAALPEPESDDNAERARHWFDLVQEHGRCTLLAAANLGDVLIEQRDLCRQESKQGGSNWSQWCEDNLPFSRTHASRYISIAEHWDELEHACSSSGEPLSIRDALRRIEDTKPKPSPNNRVTRAVRDVFNGRVPGGATIVEHGPDCSGEGTITKVRITEGADDGPMPWIAGDLKPMPEQPKDDDPRSWDEVNTWLDKATDKLLNSGVATEDDICALRHYRDVATISTAANAETVDRARQIIETNKETILANEAFFSVDVFHDSVRSIARVPQFKNNCIKDLLDFLAAKHNVEFQEWMDEKWAKQRETN